MKRDEAVRVANAAVAAALPQPAPSTSHYSRFYTEVRQREAARASGASTSSARPRQEPSYPRLRTAQAVLDALQQCIRADKKVVGLTSLQPGSGPKAIAASKGIIRSRCYAAIHKKRKTAPSGATVFEDTLTASGRRLRDIAKQGEAFFGGQEGVIERFGAFIRWLKADMAADDPSDFYSD